MSVDLRKLVAGAFGIVGNSVAGARKTVTYRRPGILTYNPATGETSSASNDLTGVPVIFVGYSRKERDADFYQGRKVSIEFGEQKALVAYDDLPIKPSMQDTIVEADGTVWRIVGHETDPTGTALHTFHVRRG